MTTISDLGLLKIYGFKAHNIAFNISKNYNHMESLYSTENIYIA